MECSGSTTILTADNYEISKIAKEINSQQCEITSVVVKLKDYLTSSDSEKRAHGMHILSSVLKELNTDICNEEQVRCLSEYFSARISDQTYIIEKSIHGLDALCHFKSYNFQMASSLFFTIQNELPLQMLKPDFKSMFYQLIQYLFKRFKSDFINLTANFVYGFLRIVDSETNSTCLVPIFEMFEEIAAVEKFEMFLEDIFDSMACYFPIIFSSHKKDKYFSIKVKLSDLLNRAMTSTPKFAQFVMQITLEKLDTESTESKISCYRLLQMAFPKYSCEDVNKFLSELWISIRIDSLKPKIENDDLAKNALLTLTKLSDVISNDSDSLKSLLEKIWTDLEISFKSPELQLMVASVKILVFFSSNNIDVFNHFFKRSSPILLQNFILNPEQNIQKSCLESFLLMVEHGRQIGVKVEKNECLKQITLLIENSINKPKEIRELVILVLNEYVHICVHEKDHLLLMIHFAMNSVQQSGFDVHLGNACFSLIENISKNYHLIISEFFIGKLLHEIETFTTINESQIIFYHNILRSLCQEPTITMEVINFIMKRLFILKNDLNNVTFHNLVTNMIETLEVCLTKFYSNTGFIHDFHENCISKFLKFLVQLYFVRADDHCPLSSNTIIQQFAQLFNNFLTFAQMKNYENIFPQIDRILLTLKTKNVSKVIGENDDLFMTLLDNSNPFQIEFILHLVYACLKSLNESFSIESLLDIFDQINYLDLNVYSDQIIQLSSMIISQIILKFNHKHYDGLDTILQKHLDEVKFCFYDKQCSKERKLFLMHSLVWICKSLFKIEKHNYLKIYVEEIVKLDYDHSFRKPISQLADIIYSQDDYWQTFHSNETLIPSKRFSYELNNFFCQKYEETKDYILLYILLTHLKFIPNNEINNNSQPENKYLIYIMKGLELNEFLGINMLCLTFLKDILQTNPDMVEQQVLTIVRLVIELAKKAASLHVRKAALNNITTMIDLFGEKHFLKLRNQFIQILRPTLGDHKRIVRSSAVRSFFKMSILGQPGSHTR